MVVFTVLMIVYRLIRPYFQIVLLPVVFPPLRFYVERFRSAPILVSALMVSALLIIGPLGLWLHAFCLLFLVLFLLRVTVKPFVLPRFQKGITAPGSSNQSWVPAYLLFSGLTSLLYHHLNAINSYILPFIPPYRCPFSHYHYLVKKTTKMELNKKNSYFLIEPKPKNRR